MKATQSGRFERYLRSERTRLERTLDELARARAGAAAGTARFSDDAAESAGGASEEDDRALAVHASRELQEIDRALAQLHDDPEGFGVCSVCGRAIGIERLRIVPGTRFCRRHAPA
jgi:RNA polymerase-binding transcription factor DksA